MLHSPALSWTPPASNSIMARLSRLPSLSYLMVESLFVDSLAIALSAHPESFERLESLQVICDVQLPSCLDKLYDALVQRNSRGSHSLHRIEFAMTSGVDQGQGNEDAIKWKELLMRLANG